ncbi:MAG TPA: hypothetical protein PKE26_10045 [Kiritimatiellia bacterium]|nr:hypothetical protein [Kiritimatiellia bacterium]HMO99438.1 hypothetical protein [Kiritimatiellia bacterium]HMP97383.1 hypothetical protein [Kiritimatiellia bacterium]
MEPTYPPFSLSRLLNTVFSPDKKETIGVLIDLPNPRDVADLAFLRQPELTIQRIAWETFYRGLKNGVATELGLELGGFYAYAITGGSNLDLPDEAWDVDGRQVSLEKDVYPNHGILLCISTYSATAPLTAFAKQYGFRGATLHGVNNIILASGLSVDYREVSREAEKLRLAMTRADAFEIDFQINGATHTLRLEIGGQEAHKSHGLCPPGAPDVANLPAGEVYYVPTSASGFFPMVYEDGTIGLMQVEDGHVTHASLIEGHPETVDAHNQKLAADPATGIIGELGFGTQRLPVSGRDIQDEKILGTLHVATGRSDHLGGDCVPDSFTDKSHATHDDILFAPFKTPKIHVSQARMYRDGKVVPVIEQYQPAAHLIAAMTGA